MAIGSALNQAQLGAGFLAEQLLLLMAMGAPVGRVHHRAGAAEMLGQGNRFWTTGCHNYGRDPSPPHRGGAIHRSRPTQAHHAYQQGHDHGPEHQLAAVFPLPTHEADH